MTKTQTEPQTKVEGDAIGNDELLTIAETARKLKCTLKTVQSMMNRGELVRIKFSKKMVRIPMSSVQELLRARTQGAE